MHCKEREACIPRRKKERAPRIEDRHLKEREGMHSKEREGMHSEERGFTGIGEIPRLERSQRRRSNGGGASRSPLPLTYLSPSSRRGEAKEEVEGRGTVLTGHAGDGKELGTRFCFSYK